MNKDGTGVAPITHCKNVIFVEMHGNKMSYLQKIDDNKYVEGWYFCDLDGFIW